MNISRSIQLFFVVSLSLGGLQVKADDSRLVAYLGNWQPCPTTDQVMHYTHIVIAFAVSYTWSPSKNQCSSTCYISTPPICNNDPNQNIVKEWQNAGKKVILSFGGAGMGGSWAHDVNDCWEYCFNREAEVANRLTDIVDELGLDGVDIDYEYFHEDNQNGSGFSKGAEAQHFLKDLTMRLRSSLPEGSELTHAPMDSDVVPGTGYYDVLMEVAPSLDFLMPQYYNGDTRPSVDGIDGTGTGKISALSHYSNLVEDLFQGDATKMIFGFCISDCGGTGSNANGAQAATVMNDLRDYYECNGGAFFWVAHHDTNGHWSSTIDVAIQTSSGCSHDPTVPTTSPPTPLPAPTSAPVITSAPTQMPTSSESQNMMCCPPTYTGLQAYDSCGKYHHCVDGVVIGNALPCADGTLFDNDLQICNWADQVAHCNTMSCGDGASDQLTFAPVINPPVTVPLNEPSSSEPCCPVGLTGLKAWDACTQYYHCVNGVVTGDLMNAPAGTLFDEILQNIDWYDNVFSTCVVQSCDSGSRKLRGANI